MSRREQRGICLAACHRERYSGSVMRRIALAGVGAESEVDAGLKDGVLEVSVTTPTAKSAKKVEIRES